MSAFIVLWYPRRNDGQVVPSFMLDGAGDDPDTVSMFDTEEDATDAAEHTPAANVWPYIVVELP
jgi:hypothetical protein